MLRAVPRSERPITEWLLPGLLSEHLRQKQPAPSAQQLLSQFVAFPPNVNKHRDSVSRAALLKLGCATVCQANLCVSDVEQCVHRQRQLELLVAMVVHSNGAGRCVLMLHTWVVRAWCVGQLRQRALQQQVAGSALPGLDCVKSWAKAPSVSDSASTLQVVDSM